MPRSCQTKWQKLKGCGMLGQTVHPKRTGAQREWGSEYSVKVPLKGCQVTEYSRFW